MIAGRRINDMWKLAVVPGELARFDQDARYGVAMSTNKLGCRMHDDISSMFKWTTEIRRGKGIIDDQGNSGFMCNVGDGANVEDIALWVANRFAIKRACAWRDCLAVIFRVSAVNEN